VFKHLISGIPRTRNRSVKKRRDVDDFCKGNVKQLPYGKYSEDKIRVIQ
jgi:hypothetical protein